MTIWNKAVDKWGVWQAAQHIAKKYDDDGPFILSQRSLELKFMGSRNQRFIDVHKSLKEGYAVVIEPY